MLQIGGQFIVLLVDRILVVLLLLISTKLKLHELQLSALYPGHKQFQCGALTKDQSTHSKQTTVKLN